MLNPKFAAKLMFVWVAAILAYQLESAGLADNGDFPRIAGRLSLCPEAGWNRDRFIYFVPVYVAKPDCYWDSGVPTSAMPVIRAARALDSGVVFHIRVLGALYAALLLTVFGLLVLRCSACVLAALPFLDISYTAYFNSFYLEAGSLVALSAVTVGAFLKNAIVFTIGALMLVTSKTQHAWLAIPLSVYAFHAFRKRIVAIALLTVAAWLIAATPVDYKAPNLWNSVFVSLLPEDPSALPLLHAGWEYTQYIGRNAYQFPDQPTADRWIQAFYRQSGYTALIGYYLTHPAAAARRVWRSGAQLHNIRPGYLGIYERRLGPWVYSWWSDGKGWAYLHVPWLAALVYAGSAVLLWRSPYRQVVALILAMAVVEFTLSCFADSTDDFRHHFLFHALCDLGLCFAAAAAWNFLRLKRTI